MRFHYIAGMASLLVIATAPAFSDTAQQEKMKTCNADAKAKALAGDARKAFMQTCLSASGATAPAAAAPATAAPAAKENSQQEKMKACNADAKAKGLKGDDHKAFMKTCLSAKPAGT
jgi:psiF repeat